MNAIRCWVIGSWGGTVLCGGHITCCLVSPGPQPADAGVPLSQCDSGAEAPQMFPNVPGSTMHKGADKTEQAGSCPRVPTQRV